MSDVSAIEWTDSTWNPWHGCHKISPGCKHCYMFRDKIRYGHNPNVVVRSKTTFDAPLKWKEPRKVFTCSWSDWFIEEADPWRDEAYDIIRRTPHQYQVLTKRIERATSERLPVEVLLNMWLGVSVESAEYKDRINMLRDTPAAIRFLSIEPLLEDIGELDLRGIDWVIVGGESGPESRPMHPRWVREIRNQCAASKVSFLFKQWGEWTPGNAGPGGDLYDIAWKAKEDDAGMFTYCDVWTPGGPNPFRQTMVRVGKKAAGRILDGRTWDQFPEVRP